MVPLTNRKGGLIIQEVTFAKPSLQIVRLAGTCPVPLWRDARGQGAQYKVMLHCREALECLPRPKGVAEELHKIFGDIRARALLPAVGREFPPAFSGGLLWWGRVCFSGGRRSSISEENDISH